MGTLDCFVNHKITQCLYIIDLFFDLICIGNTEQRSTLCYVYKLSTFHTFCVLSHLFVYTLGILIVEYLAYTSRNKWFMICFISIRYWFLNLCVFIIYNMNNLFWQAATFDEYWITFSYIVRRSLLCTFISLASLW